jgi:hypothetical protein
LQMSTVGVDSVLKALLWVSYYFIWISYYLLYRIKAMACFW